MQGNSAAVRLPDCNERPIANDLSRFVLLGNRVRTLTPMSFTIRWRPLLQQNRAAGSDDRRACS